jgi:hypothetical protein
MPTPFITQIPKISVYAVAQARDKHARHPRQQTRRPHKPIGDGTVRKRSRRPSSLCRPHSMLVEDREGGDRLITKSVVSTIPTARSRQVLKGGSHATITL